MHLCRAEDDKAKALKIVEAGSPKGALVESVGRASEGLVKALELRPGEYKLT